MAVDDIALGASQLSAMPVMMSAGVVVAVAVDVVSALQSEAGEPGLGAGPVLAEGAQVGAAQPGGLDAAARAVERMTWLLAAEPLTSSGAGYE